MYNNVMNKKYQKFLTRDTISTALYSLIVIPGLIAIIFFSAFFTDTARAQTTITETLNHNDFNFTNDTYTTTYTPATQGLCWAPNNPSTQKLLEGRRRPTAEYWGQTANITADELTLNINVVGYHYVAEFVFFDGAENQQTIIINHDSVGATDTSISFTQVLQDVASIVSIEIIVYVDGADPNYSLCNSSISYDMEDEPTTPGDGGGGGSTTTDPDDDEDEMEEGELHCNLGDTSDEELEKLICSAVFFADFVNLAASNSIVLLAFFFLLLVFSLLGASISIIRGG